jgi:outer membrane protein
LAAAVEGTINTKLNTDMKRTLLIALFASLITTGNVLGQQAQRITLQEAIKIALENNYQLKQAENNLELSNENIINSYADFLPDLNASTNASRGIGRNFNQNTGQIEDDPNNSLSFSLSTSIPLFTGFQRINSLRNSQQIKISREESLNRAKESLIFTTASSFLQVILTQELLEIDKENLQNSLKQLETIVAQVEVGSIPLVDQYNQEAQVANDELAVTQRENTLQINKLQLIRQLQIDPLGNYVFVIPDVGEDNLNTMQFDLKTLIDEALAGRSDIRSEEASIEALEYSLQGAKGSILPSLSFSAGVSTYWDERIKDIGISFNDQVFDQNINRRFSLNLNIPIFNNLDRKYSIQSSQVQLKNAQLSLDNTKLEVIQEVTQAYNDYTSYLKQKEATEKSLFASEKSYETQQERYNVGASTLLELSQAQANYVAAQSNYKQSIFNLIFQEKLLDFYLGKLSGDDIEF